MGLMQSVCQVLSPSKDCLCLDVSIPSQRWFSVLFIMLEWDLTGPLAFCSGFQPNGFGEAAKKLAFSPYCLLSNIFSVLKNIYTFCS